MVTLITLAQELHQEVIILITTIRFNVHRLQGLTTRIHTIRKEVSLTILLLPAVLRLIRLLPEATIRIMHRQEAIVTTVLLQEVIVHLRQVTVHQVVAVEAEAVEDQEVHADN